MRVSVDVNDPYYRRISQEQRDQLHAWVDTFTDHRRTASVKLEHEGLVSTEEIQPYPPVRGFRYVKRYHTPATPPPWFGWGD